MGCECQTVGMPTARTRAKRDEDAPEVGNVRLVYAIAGVGERDTLFRDVEITAQLRKLIDKGLAELVEIDGYGEIATIEEDPEGPTDS